MGARGDAIVDEEGVDEAASFYGAGAPVWLEGGHDVMLDLAAGDFSRELGAWMDAQAL